MPILSYVSSTVFPSGCWRSTRGVEERSDKCDEWRSRGRNHGDPCNNFYPSPTSYVVHTPTHNDGKRYIKKPTNNHEQDRVVRSGLESGVATEHAGIMKRHRDQVGDYEPAETEKFKIWSGHSHGWVGSDPNLRTATISLTTKYQIRSTTSIISQVSRFI